MARWSIVKDGLGLDSVEIVRNCKRNRLYFDHDSPVNGFVVDDCKDRLRSLFDQVLTCFLREVSMNKYICTIPALLGDGRPTDLFKLFWVVRKRGGYNVVSKNGLWGYVAKECGLGVGVLASVKLIYSKYLSELDRQFRQVLREKSWGNRESGVVEKLNFLSLELEEFKGTLSNGKGRKTNDGRPFEPESTKNGRTSKLHLLEGENSDTIHDSSKRSICDDDEKFTVQDDNDIVLLAKSVVEKVVNPRKKKRRSLSFSEMLKWVIHVAKHHDDPAIGRIPECSKWKEYGSNELWVQALLAREALFRRKHVDSVSEESHLQKKPRMHPSMYEDNDVQKNHQSTDRLIKRLCMTKSHLCPCCNSCSPTQTKLSSPRKVEENTTPKEPAPANVENPTTNTSDDTLKDEPAQKQACVGPLFQAEIPAWTGTVTNSDSKWLGTRMWPPQDGQYKPLLEMDPIGKGRQISCDCFLPGSTECVRFHIAEKRMRLKLQLGLLFYRWRFDRMGEEVSLSWSIEEEKRFKEMTLNYTSQNKFWPNAFRLFPTKTREKLVSYYFNVLLVRRRSYQNRVTPKNIDSDDDETEFGSVGGNFGYEAIHVQGSKLSVCSENAQCFDLE